MFRHLSQCGQNFHNFLLYVKKLNSILIGVRANFSRGAEPSLPENYLTATEKLLS